MALLLCHVRSSIDDSRVLDLGAMGGATPPERSRRLRTGNPGLGLERHPFATDVHPFCLIPSHEVSSPRRARVNVVPDD